jgi:hypothetical protein
VRSIAVIAFAVATPDSRYGHVPSDAVRFEQRNNDPVYLSIRVTHVVRRRAVAADPVGPSHIAWRRASLDKEEEART